MIFVTHLLTGNLTGLLFSLPKFDYVSLVLHELKKIWLKNIIICLRILPDSTRCSVSFLMCLSQMFWLSIKITPTRS